jgi:hypothetical protein
MHAITIAIATAALLSIAARLPILERDYCTNPQLHAYCYTPDSFPCCQISGSLAVCLPNSESGGTDSPDGTWTFRTCDYECLIDQDGVGACQILARV